MQGLVQPEVFRADPSGQTGAEPPQVGRLPSEHGLGLVAVDPSEQVGQAPSEHPTLLCGGFPSEQVGLLSSEHLGPRADPFWNEQTKTRQNKRTNFILQSMILAF